MTNDTLVQIVIPGGVLLCVAMGFFIWQGGKKKLLDRRIARVTSRKTLQKGPDALSLRRKERSGLPVIGKMLSSFAPMASLQARLDRAGLHISSDLYAAICAVTALLAALVIVMIMKSPLIAGVALLMIGWVIPNLVIGIMGSIRVKNFLLLFPDALDFMVRGLRSGLPVTESMNMIGAEMTDPVKSIFASIGESVRLGVSLEKALQDTANKLHSTEFNFFVTSIILQRETGGNLSEILGNLSDMLRKRFMMKMKIKAISSEARASAYILGSLPFVVMLALLFVSPGYLDPLANDARGHVAAAAAGFSLFCGVGIMMRMAQFEI